MLRSSLLAAVSSLALLGCGSSSTSTGPARVDQSATAVKGSFQLGESLVAFTSTVRDDGFVDVELSLHGMTLTALVDTKTSVAENDGFATSGSDTQMTDADRKVLVALAHQLEKQFGNTRTTAQDVLVRTANLWSEHPDSLSLTQQILGDQSRSNGYCGAMETWQWATHDGPWLVGCDMDDWDPRTTSAVLIGDRWGGTHYWVNNNWITDTQDHQPYVYEAGDCYGHCGESCPNGDQTLTQNCADHDQCVRNGHDLAAVSCDDEFVSAAADYVFSNDCPGT